MKNGFKIVLFLLLGFTLNVRAQNDIMPISEIKPGMKGYGLTVFKGKEIEKFDAEIISVLHNFRPKGDLILARLSGNKVIDKAGVIAGMSGSPVYIDGKIIGAVAFSWPFSKEPITGITPIGEMIDIMNRKYTTNFYNFEPNITEDYYVKNSGYNLVPIKTPLVIQGLSEDAISLFKKEFEQIGFLPVAGGSIGTGIKSPDKFEPGSAVGVNLITGDMNMSAIGTVTYVDKDRIVIFGHPMFFSGKSDLPLSYAYIYTVLPSLEHSFKIGTSTEIVGRIYQDQIQGLAGVVGESAKMIPVEVDINYQGNEKRYKYDIARSYSLIQRLVYTCIVSSIQMTGGQEEKNTINAKFDITFNNNKKIEVSDIVPGVNINESLTYIMSMVLNPISQILINKFEEIAIKDIKSKLTINTRVKMVEIKKIITDRKEYKPGETVNAKILLREYQGKDITKEVKFKLPYNLPDNVSVPIIVSSSKEEQYIDALLSPEKFVPYNFNQLIDIINNLAKNNELSIWSLAHEKGVVINGQKLERIPSSYFSILKDSLETGAEPIITLLKNKYPFNYVIVGNASCRINIKKIPVIRRE